MIRGGYQVIDEPRPGLLSRFSVGPIWPLLSFMFCGYWFAVVWSLFNGHALGSPTRKQEFGVAISGLIALALIFFGLDAIWRNDLLIKEVFPYLFLLFPVTKIATMYWLLLLQSRTTDLFQHFGGKLINGLPIIVAGYFIGTQVNPWFRSTFLGFILV